MGHGILLEAGTNEMELLEFGLGNTPLGINVAKVREIIQRVKTISIPHSPPAVEGSFMLRDDVLTLVNLGKYFDMSGENTSNGEGMIIIVEFNNIRCGILVDTVDRIHRLSWSQIDQPSPILSDLQTPVTGTVNISDKTILIVDFETVIGNILGVSCVNSDLDAPAEDIEPCDLKIILTDDSVIVRKTIANVLKNNGYTNLTICSDGEQAWNKIKEVKESGTDPFDLVLSDIEMPRMDGLHLTSRIKEDPDLNSTPVILFSSLITDDNRKKGIAVGADAQISKPNSEELIRVIKEVTAAKLQTS